MRNFDIIMMLALISMFASIVFLSYKIDQHSQTIKLLSKNQLMMLKRERKNVVKELQNMKEEGTVRYAPSDEN